MVEATFIRKTMHCQNSKSIRIKLQIGQWLSIVRTLLKRPGYLLSCDNVSNETLAVQRNITETRFRNSSLSVLYVRRSPDFLHYLSNLSKRRKSSNPGIFTKKLSQGCVLRIAWYEADWITKWSMASIENKKLLVSCFQRRYFEGTAERI